MTMIPWWWSYLLTVVGAFGLFLAGQRSAWGWAVGLGAQVLWVWYAAETQQPGFFFSAAIYGSVYMRNFLAWRRAGRR